MASLSSHSQQSVPVKTRYEAAMVLGAVGDAMGYGSSRWEFEERGSQIHKEVQDLGGVASLRVELPDFILSDDSILHIATAEGLVSEWTDREKLLHNIAERYIEGARDMGGRAPGSTTLNGIYMLQPGTPKGTHIPFNSRGGGCGAAMRSAPIGLAFPRPDQVEDLVAVAIESGRMTHNHPTGFLGSLAAALFVSYALQGKPPKEWGVGLLQTLDIAMKYIEEADRDVEQNKNAWGYFKNSWSTYLELRGIVDGKSEPKFPPKYGVDERDAFYRSISFRGWGGASGHDAPIIAYDAILGAGDSWEELCLRGVLHGGDNDSTGIIACSAWGAMYGFKGVSDLNHCKLEYRDRLQELAASLYERAWKADR